MNGKISNFAQVASLRRYTLTEGRGRGLDVIDCDTGKLRFLLNVSKALDVMQVYHGGQNVSFLSKNAFTAAELPFIRRFEGGMVYTCGLDSAGRREGYELHGSLHNTPAEILRAECGEKGIVVEAVIRDTALFGRNLVLRRRITAGIGAETLTIEDTVVNEGYTDTEYCILYHINVGYPLLDEGARIVADVEEAYPCGEWSESKKNEMLDVTAPVAGEEETCYYLKLKKPQIALENKAAGKRVTVCYGEDTLPCFLMWKSMASGDYAVGLEPCTSRIGSELDPKIIGAGERISFRVTVGVENV